MIPIIDTHQHLWDLTIFHLPWQKDNPKLARSFVMRDYLEATAGLNVVKSIYMEVDVEPSQQPAEADHVIAICQRGDTPMAAAVISGRPASDGFADYITGYKQSPYIKGVRQVLHVPETPPGYCLDERFIQGIRLLGTLGLSFDICCRSTELPRRRQADRRVPRHAVHPRPLRQRQRPGQGPRALAGRHRRDRPAEERRLQGLGHRGLGRTRPWTADDLAPIINHVLDTFGPDRVMFGGDWPVCTLAATYRQWVEALKAIVATRSRADQQKLFHDNAVRVLWPFLANRRANDRASDGPAGSIHVPGRPLGGQPNRASFSARFRRCQSRTALIASSHVTWVSSR